MGHKQPLEEMNPMAENCIWKLGGGDEEDLYRTHEKAQFRKIQKLHNCHVEF